MELTLIFFSLLTQQVLGVSNKIINGALARDGQFPHMVQISIRTFESTQYCGGTLINDQWVLSAAHCFTKMISAKAYLGSAFWRTMPVRMKIADVVVHEKYFNINNDDIALAKLERPVNFTENIQPAQLPSRTEEMFNSTLFVPGFGDTKNASQSMLYLRFIRMKEITNEECSTAWGWKMNEQKVCGLGIDNINHTTCKGDSGNGIVTKDEKGAKVLGIVSYGPPGCLGKPKVFTRVSKYLDFIYAVTKIDIEDF